MDRTDTELVVHIWTAWCDDNYDKLPGGDYLLRFSINTTILSRIQEHVQQKESTAAFCIGEKNFPVTIINLNEGTTGWEILFRPEAG